MTGFGEAAAELNGVHYFLEIRSLNARYFKAVIRLPEVYQGLEAEVEAELRRRLKRGSVTLSATATDASAQAAYSINHAALESYIQQIHKTPAVAGGQVKLDLGPLLALPGVLQPPVDEEDRLERARAAFLSLLDKAAAGLSAMRAREGAMLLEDLLLQRDTIVDRLKVVRERSPQIVRDFELRLRNRVDTLLKDSGLALQPVDIIREIAAYAERTDISEEITRLTGHIEQFTELLSARQSAPAVGANGAGGAGGAARVDERSVGRTLDFLTQEMLREANTMASKSSDATASKAIVEIKGAIDRIKEQVQNVE